MSRWLSLFRSAAVRLLAPALIFVGAQAALGQVTEVDLSTYVRVGRFDLPEPTRTAPPVGSLLASEASGVTYNWDTGTLFVVGDEGTAVVEISKTGALLSSMTLAAGQFNDTEGIAYVGGGKFVLIEERTRQAILFLYIGGDTLEGTDVQTVKLGTTIGNVGLEGLTYDSATAGFIFVKEKDPQAIFQTGIDFDAGTATNGSPTTDASVNLFDPALLNLADLSDVFALSNLTALDGLPDSSHLLIISQESGQIVEIDRSGAVLSTLTIVADAGSPLTVEDMTMEGIAMDSNGVLYVVNESGGGDSNHPQVWVYEHSDVPNMAPTAISLLNPVTSIPENTSTAAAVRMASIVVEDDGLGANVLSLAGDDADSFEIIGAALFLRAGTALDSIAKPTYNVTVEVDDPTVGSDLDASVEFELAITSSTGGTAALIISEVAPWSSGNSPAGFDWFEVTNIGSAALSITGWKMDDNSNSFGSAVDLTGITSIAPGESVLFVESSNLTNAAAAFKPLWFGASPPATLQIGAYSGSGVGLSTGGDAVNIFDTAGAVRANVTFGPSPSGPFPTFDNAAGLNNAEISLLSAVGVNGAFVAPGDADEIGSPGRIGDLSTPTVTIIATDPAAAEAGMDPGVFQITRSGGTASSLSVNFIAAAGPGQADSSDYSPVLTGVALIPAGQSFVSLTITPVDDSLNEGDETVTLTLSDTGTYDVGAPGTATITIADNDLVNLAPTGVVLSNVVSVIAEDRSTASPIKVADIEVLDDGLGTNNLSLNGPDSASFSIVGSALFLKAGMVLNSAAKPSFSVFVQADDPAVGGSTDASVHYTLAVLPPTPPGSILITEVAPWSSGDSPIGFDWIEVTNVSANPVDIAGWKVDDSSASFGNAASLTGVNTIGPGESVIFIESDEPAGDIAAFKALWFGAAAGAGLQVGTYDGSGLGLSTNGDAVNLFNTAGVLQASVSFGESPGNAPFATFDNSAGLNNATISQLSVVGVNSAFTAANDADEIGSPGSIGALAITEVAPWSSGNSPVGFDWFEVTNTSAFTLKIAGWRMDDNSNAFGNSVALNGITSIAPGESVIFIESDAPVGDAAAFKALWFGAAAPAALKVGGYSGSGVGLSTNGDAVNLFNAGGVRQASVGFGGSPGDAPVTTFENPDGLSSFEITQLSAIGVNGAFPALNDQDEIGSPGRIANVQMPASFLDSLQTSAGTKSFLRSNLNNARNYVALGSYKVARARLAELIEQVVGLANRAPGDPHGLPRNQADALILFTAIDLVGLPVEVGGAPALPASAPSTIAGLLAEVQGLNTSGGSKNYLQSLLSNVQNYLNLGALKLAEERMALFIKEATALSHRNPGDPNLVALAAANRLILGGAKALIAVR